MVHVVDLSIAIDAVLDDRGHWTQTCNFGFIQISQLVRNVTNGPDPLIDFVVFDAFITFDNFLEIASWILRKDKPNPPLLNFERVKHFAA